MEALAALLSSPAVQSLAILAAGGALTFGWGAAAYWWRWRGRNDVERCADALKRAKLTPQKEDDAVAELALRRAQDREGFLDALATASEKLNPGELLAALSRVKK